MSIAQEKTAKIKQNREVNYYLIDAKNALSQGNLQKAISLYSKCIILKKDCATAHYELANIAIAVKDLDEALKNSRKAVALAPQNSWYQVQLAQIFEARGMLQQAGETYLTLAKLEKQNKLYLQKSAMLFETIENWDKALEVYTLLEKEYGKKFEILAQKQALYKKAGREEEGIKELQKLVKNHPKNSEYCSLLAISYQENNKPKKATKMFEKIAKLDSISSVAEIMLYHHYMGLKEYPQAYNSLKNAIKSQTIKEEVIINSVVGLLQIDTVKNHRTVLSNLLIEKYPENAVGYLFKAQEYRENKKNNEAKTVLEKALSINPTNYNGLAQLCVIQNIEKEWDSLYETAKKGVTYYPQEHLFYIFKGLSASQKKEYLVAESALTTGYLYAREKETQKEIQELLADVYYKNGKIEQSFELFEKLISENPNSIMILNNYAYFLSLENRELDKAEKLSKKTIEEEPENATYLDTYAWILYQQEKYEEALYFMGKAIKNLEKEEGSADMWEHYGDIFFKLGNKEKAMQKWKKALTLPNPETKRLKQKIEENN